MTKAYNGFANVPDATDELDTIRFIIGQAMNGMATATLVLVKAVNAGKVDAQPMIHQIDGAGNTIEHGTIHALPFLNMRAGGSAVKLTPRPGDIGLAVFCHSDISSVKNTAAPAAPGTRRRFDWGDGVYIGGLLGAAPTQFIELDDDTGITITAASGKPITITAPGGLTVTGDITVTGQITATGDITGNGTSLHTHTHGGVATGSGTSGQPS